MRSLPGMQRPTRTRARYSPGTSPTCPTLATSARWTGRPSSRWTSSAAVSPVSPGRRRGNGKALTMTDTCGPTLPEPFAFFDPATSSWRRSQGSLLEEGWTSCLPTSARSGSMRSGALYLRPPLGACHQRERLFVVAADASSPGRSRDAATALAQEEPDRRRRAHGGDLTTGSRDGLPVADAGGVRREGRPLVGVAHGAAATYSGPSLAADADGSGPEEQRRQPAHDGQPWDDAAGRGAGDGAVLARMPDGTVRDYGPALARHAAVLGRPWPAPTIGRSLNGDFSAWMMMFPKGWLDGLSNGAKKRLAGNAVVTRQAVAALSELGDRLLARAEVAA